MDGFLKSPNTAAPGAPAPGTNPIAAAGGAPQGFHGNDQGWIGSLVGQYLGGAEGLNRASAGGMEPNALTDAFRRIAPSFSSHVTDASGFPHAQGGPGLGVGSFSLGAQPSFPQVGGGVTPGPGPRHAPATPFLGQPGNVSVLRGK